MLKDFSMGGDQPKGDVAGLSRGVPPLKRAIYATASIEAITAAGQVADWVRLLPIGEVKTNDARQPWRVVDLAHAQKIVSDSLERAAGRDLAIDYDHQTDFGAVPGVGGTAPAAGWMKQVEAREDGIWAQVEWTPAAAEKLAAREYRYISPTFLPNKDRNVALILRAALTNNPALDLGAVASGQPVEEDSDDMLKDIALALGLPETATQEEVLAAITANAQAATVAAEALASLRTAAGLAADVDAPAICAAVTALREGDGSDLAQLRGQVATLTTQLNTVQASAVRATAEAAVGALVKAGKIVPATAPTFIAMAIEQPVEFANFCAAQPVVVAPGDVQREQLQDEAVTLTAEDRAVCASMGLTEEQFLTAKKG